MFTYISHRGRQLLYSRLQVLFSTYINFYLCQVKKKNLNSFSITNTIYLYTVYQFKFWFNLDSFFVADFLEFMD